MTHKKFHELNLSDAYLFAATLEYIENSTDECAAKQNDHTIRHIHRCQTKSGMGAEIYAV